MKISKWASIAAIVGLLFLSACSGSGAMDGAKDSVAKQATANQPNTESFTLHVMVSGAVVPEQTVQRFETAAFSAKYPNVKFKYSNIAQLEELVAAGDIPDLMNITPANIYRVQDAGLTYDLTELAKKNNLDLSKFNKSALDGIRAIGAKQGLIAIPDKPPGFPYLAVYGVAYNKDLFDKFAIPYPKDNMTWDEILELAKRFYRTDGGTQYYGLTMAGPANAMIQSMGLDFLDKNGKVNLSDPKWGEITRIARTATENQGNWTGAWQGNMNFFTKDKNVAMFIGTVASLVRGADTFEGSLNWDLVTFPRFSNQPKPVVPYSSGVYMISAKSKYKDAAFDLITTSVYQGNTDQAAFENQYAVKRHLDAIKNQAIGLATPNKFSTTFSQNVQKKVAEMAVGTKDSNTTLRELQDEMQKVVDEAK